ncbi:hypothetical protein [Paenibacillus chitinolyticus]|uniref:hypothetical protein n=1 Tax=Paenibacillus chitinolyticus TaxID=79263 RepID=UPI001C437071|nr:hypothetical protein [Paenibacillus chitinolyticus]MBV6716908.1 hypothetical protein [Paenibacillus chitinolyticus]
MKGRKINLFFSIISLFIIIIYVYVMDKTAASFWPTLIFISSVAFNLFTSLYLYPQQKDEDERFKLIKNKGMYYSYFINLIYILGIIIVFTCNPDVDPVLMLIALLGLVFVTPSILWIFFSKVF